MKLRVFHKVCLTVMGVGVVGSLVSVGTFATYTASVTNSGNTFAAGTLTLTDTTADTAKTFSATNPNFTAASARGPVAECTNAAGYVASACTPVIKAVRAAATGIEPGQFLQESITITNNGTLPALVGLTLQNVTTTAGTGAGNSLGACASDLASASTTGATAACTDLGNGLRVSIDVAGKCIFGSATSPVSVSTNVYKPDTSGCDDLTSAANLGNSGTASSLTSTQDVFGTSASPANGTFTKLLKYTAGTGPFVWIGGSSAGANTLTNATVFGGDLTSFKPWAPAEAKTFTITLSFPDTGYGTASIGSDSVPFSKDNQYSGGSAGFDLVFVATQ